MDMITIPHHNVAHWKIYGHNLTNTYRDKDSEIILYNSDTMEDE